MNRYLAVILLSLCLLMVSPQPTPAAPHLNDAWELDIATNTWTELTPAGPLPGVRRYAAHAYDSQRNRLIVAGGQGDWSTLNYDTWALDLTKGEESWTLLSDSNPDFLGYRGTVYDASRDQLVVFHHTMFVGVFDLSTNSWSTPLTTGPDPNPTNHTSYSAVYDAANDRYVLFGGGSGTDPANYTNRVRVLDPKTWTWSDLSFPAAMPLPDARSLASAVYDPDLQRLLAYGGVLPGGYGGGITLDDTWQLTLTAGSEAWTQLLPAVAPPTRGQHARAFDSARGRKIVFGGLIYSDNPPYAALNDVWVFDGSTWNNPFPAGPRPLNRRGAHAVYDVPNDRFIVFGGEYLPGLPNYLDATINIDPDTLNLKSQGQWITCYITLPAGFDVSTIDVTTVGIIKINQDVIDPPLMADVAFGGQVGDYDDDLVPDLTIKFDRQELINLPLLIGDAGITIKGQMTTGDFFSGSDTIRVIRRGK